MSKILYQDNFKRFYLASDYFKNKFGKKFRRLPIDAGFSCPGRCIYCSTAGSLANISAKTVDSILKDENIDYSNRFNERFALSQRYELIKKQIENFFNKNKELYDPKNRKILLYLYYQAFSNTYDKPQRMKSIYDYSLSLANFDGIFIGTRPDCIDEQKAIIISEYLKNYDVWVELGLQSAHDRTLEYVNRKHSVNDFEKAVKILKKNGIKVIAHLIIGLGDEDIEDLIETVKFISQNNLDGVKFHNLYILPNTKILNYYERGFQKVLTSDQYIFQLSEAIQYLKDDIVIFRLFSDPEEGYIAPKWEKNKTQLIKEFEYLCKEKDIWQGKLWS